MSTRREFLSGAAIATGVLAMETAPVVSSNVDANLGTPLNILILGGTGYIGPYFVRAALERGHKVSVFNRGKSKANLPAEVERLTGDRDGDLRSIESREWDAVIDLPTLRPLWVRTLGETLRKRTRHYTFISTIDVYKNPSSNLGGTHEHSGTLQYDVGIDPYTHTSAEIESAAKDRNCRKDDSMVSCLLKSSQYGPLKVLCELEAEKQFPGKALIVRPGYMVGPGDEQGRFIYWIARLERGGDILAPGDPLQPVQFIDVRDVSDWVIRMIERAEAGTYNALGPGNSMSMCEMLGGIRSIFGTAMKLNWVSIPWLRNQDIVDPEVARWMIWCFSRDDAINSDKAVAKGLTYRPLAVTARDTFEWYRQRRDAAPVGAVTGLKADDTTGQTLEYEVTPWNEILERERQILAHWRIHQSRF